MRPHGVGSGATRKDPPPGSGRARPRDDHADGRRSGPAGHRSRAPRRPRTGVRRSSDRARDPGFHRLLPPQTAARGGRDPHPRRGHDTLDLVAPRRPRGPLPRPRGRPDPLVNVAVVGAGIVGLSAAFALVERGFDVTVYERGEPGAAQSGGESRIFRPPHDDPRLVALAVSRREVWREWEERFGVELISGDGSVLIGPAVEPGRALLRDAGVPVREIAAHPLGPGPGLLDPAAGVIRTRAAVSALVSAVGDRLVRDEVVAVGSDGTVRSGGEIAEYDRVIVCAGRDTAVLAGRLALPVAVTTHVRLTFPLRDG